MIIYYLTSLILCVASCVSAISPDHVKEREHVPRIMELLPNLISPLGVDPAIPANFVAMNPHGELDPCEWIYWGPKDVLENYFKNPIVLPSPILRVKLTANMHQTTSGRFDDSDIRCIQQMKRQDPSTFTYRETKWGGYPVIAVKVKMCRKTALMAWVGANDPDSGNVLMFNLVIPEERLEATPQEVAFWNQFIDRTTQLTEQDYFCALGQDLQPGYTIVRAGGTKLKMTAEKRECDDKVQVVVVPTEPGVTFVCEDIEECRLGSHWNYGAPLVKVYGVITKEIGNWASVTECITSILPETVRDFSVSPDDRNIKTRRLIFQTDGISYDGMDE